MIQVDEICERGRDGPPPRRLRRVGGSGGGGGRAVGRSVGLAESASADSQKPSDVERGGGGSGGGCANLERLPACPRQHQCPIRRFAKRPPPPSLPAHCLAFGDQVPLATLHTTKVKLSGDMHWAKFAALPRDKFES